MGKIKIKRIGVEFLRESGLLFEINRRVLHQFGLALEIYVAEEGSDLALVSRSSAGEKVLFTGGEAFGQVWDYRDDPEGIAYGAETFRGGRSKFRRFMRTFGSKRLKTRKGRLGFIVQTRPEAK